MSTSNIAESNPRIQSARSTTDSRILQLLGSGAPTSVVAAATGVSESYISQLISQSDFKSELQELKFTALHSHNVRDRKYDAIEDKLTKQLEDNICLIQKPGELLRALQVVNGLKRRGASAPEAVVQQQTVVTLTMPQKIVQHFTTNINNQVVSIGDQSLQTMQSNTLRAKLDTRELRSPETQTLVIGNESTPIYKSMNPTDMSTAVSEHKNENYSPTNLPTRSSSDS